MKHRPFPRRLPEQAPVKVVKCPVVRTIAEANWYLNRGYGVGIDYARVPD